MCGIAVVSRRGGPSGSSRAAGRAVLRAMAHRGPDDEGMVAVAAASGEHHVLLGATRLAILDPGPAGHQPFEEPQTGSWLGFNGESDNHKACREALGPLRWRSRCDTETVLRCALAWGPGCLDRFRGMFAFVFWDGRDGSLWCARDRLGIKPLDLHAAEDRVLLASELRALLELTGDMRSMLLRDGDAMAMAASLELRVPFHDHTLVELCLRHQAALREAAGRGLTADLRHWRTFWPWVVLGHWLGAHLP